MIKGSTPVEKLGIAFDIIQDVTSLIGSTRNCNISDVIMLENLQKLCNEVKEFKSSSRLYKDSKFHKSEHELAFDKWLLTGNKSHLTDFQKQYDHGFAIPETYAYNLANAIGEFSPLRRICNVINISTYEYNTFNDSPLVDTYTDNELSAINIVAEELITNTSFYNNAMINSNINIFDWLISEISKKFGVYENRYFINTILKDKRRFYLNGIAHISDYINEDWSFMMGYKMYNMLMKLNMLDYTRYSDKMNIYTINGHAIYKNDLFDKDNTLDNVIIFGDFNKAFKIVDKFETRIKRFADNIRTNVEVHRWVSAKVIDNESFIIMEIAQ
jgi:predicted phage gp36 major capsid-like protein